jgi:hypothetical protein
MCVWAFYLQLRLHLLNIKAISNETDNVNIL